MGVIQGNRPYDGRPAFFLIASIVVATITLIVIIVILCKYKKKRRPISLAIFTVFLICSIGVIIFIGIGRKAKNDDIYINLDQEISINMNFEVKTYENIDDLEITFQFKDKNGKILSTKIKRIGDVKRSNSYNVAINFTEFSSIEILNIDSISATVTGGRTSYI